MKKENFTRNIVLTVILLVILIAASNLAVYFRLKQDYTLKLDALSRDVDEKDIELSNRISEESEYSAAQRESLEDKTMQNFVKLQDYLSTETSRLKLDLETVKQTTASDIQDISTKVGGLEERSDELEEKSDELSQKLSEINVESSDFSDIVEDVVKAVVSVKTNKGQGSGVFFDKDGYIITNKHVIEGASSIRVYDYNSKGYDAVLLGTASNVDLAVLKIDAEVNYLEFADMSDVKVGQRVIAVGNPLGLSFSVTEGIISGLNRVTDDTGLGYIQTDVPINSGNSGGPLVNSAKEIVGINTFKISDTEGLGFAIPANVAENIAQQALDQYG